MIRLIPLLLVLPFAAGCGSGRPAAEVDRARHAVEAALDSWKANEPPDRLKTRPEPADFAEELRATHALAGYAIVKADASDKDVIRFTVTLTLKDKKGKASE